MKRKLEEIELKYIEAKNINTFEGQLSFLQFLLLKRLDILNGNKKSKIVQNIINKLSRIDKILYYFKSGNFTLLRNTLFSPEMVNFKSCLRKHIYEEKHDFEYIMELHRYTMSQINYLARIYIRDCYHKHSIEHNKCTIESDNSRLVNLGMLHEDTRIYAIEISDSGLKETVENNKDLLHPACYKSLLKWCDDSCDVDWTNIDDIEFMDQYRLPIVIFYKHWSVRRGGSMHMDIIESKEDEKSIEDFRMVRYRSIYFATTLFFNRKIISCEMIETIMFFYFYSK